MQLVLPIFRTDVKLINETLGVFSNDGIVNYLHSGMPIYCHAEDDYKSFRFVTSKFIQSGLCTRREISDCFGVTYDSVKRYAKRLAEEGDSVFFREDGRQGSCHKLVPAVLARMQKYLDDGKSNSEIARLENVTEGAVRYAIKQGKLKKK